MNTIQEIQKINERELELGLAGTSASWHETYRKSAWIYIGNVSFELCEGDLLCVLSQYGEIDDLWLVRNETTGISRGFAYAKYVDSRSCVLAVDNFIGITLCGRPLRVEHVDNMRLPEKLQQKTNDDDVNVVAGPIASQAYGVEDLANQYSIHHGQDLFAPPPPPPALLQEEPDDPSLHDDNSTKKKTRSSKRHSKYSSSSSGRSGSR
jgi:RNA-binding motif protein, X-linked 2